MKNIILSITILFLFAFCFIQCKKDDEPTNIEFYNKPTNTIEHYIKGKWRVQLQKGGFCGTCIINLYPYHIYYEFGDNYKIKTSTQNIIKIDTSYKWVTDKSDYLRHIIEFYEPHATPPFAMHLEPVSIKDDTLIISNPNVTSPDNSLFYLTKEN